METFHNIIVSSCMMYTFIITIEESYVLVVNTSNKLNINMYDYFAIL